MRPAEYATKPASAKALPKVTLPGPALPRELMSLQAAGLVPIRKVGRRREQPPSRFGWMTKYVVVAILLTAGVATYSMMPGTSASAPPRPAPATGARAARLRGRRPRTPWLAWWK